MAEIEPVDDPHAGFASLLPVQAAGVWLQSALPRHRHRQQQGGDALASAQTAMPQKQVWHLLGQRGGDRCDVVRLLTQQQQLAAITPAVKGLGHDPICAELVLRQPAHQLLDWQIGWQPIELMGATHQLQDLGRSGRPLGGVTNMAALSSAMACSSGTPSWKSP